MTLPKVSFLSPVLNEANNLEGYLKNIREQDYPQDRIEIIIADGGSKDNTVDIAKRFGCRVILNLKRLAEPGLVLCEEAAIGDLNVVMAADNRMPRKDWLRLMTKPFIEDSNIWGAFTHIEVDEKDNSFNKYYSLLHVEPFTWFIYGYTCNPRYFKYAYKVAESRDNYVVYSFSMKDHPLLAFAQGFVWRSQFKRQKENRGDDVLPFIQMIKEGHKLAYVPEAGIYHFHLNNFQHYLSKYSKRIRSNFYNKDIGFQSRLQYITQIRKVREYLWLIYGVSIVGPAMDSLRWYLKDKNKCWFWHIPACVGLTYLILYELMRKKYFEFTRFILNK